MIGQIFADQSGAGQKIEGRIVERMQKDGDKQVPKDPSAHVPEGTAGEDDDQHQRVGPWRSQGKLVDVPPYSHSGAATQWAKTVSTSLRPKAA